MGNSSKINTWGIQHPPSVNWTYADVSKIRKTETLSKSNLADIKELVGFLVSIVLKLIGIVKKWIFE